MGKYKKTAIGSHPAVELPRKNPEKGSVHRGGSKGHINEPRRILYTMVSEIPLVLGLGTNM